MRVIFHLFLLLIFGFIDLFLTILAFAFYNPTFSFNISRIIDFFDISAYSFWTSPLDFLFLSLIRQLLIISCCVYIKITKNKSNKQSVLAIFVDFVAIFCYVFSIFKLLCFDETPGLTSQAGIWINLFLSITFSVLTCVIIRKTVITGQFSYQTLVEEPSTSSDAENLLENGNNETIANGRTETTTTTSTNNASTSESDDSEDNENDNEKLSEDEKRLPFLSHIWCIAKLCAPQWKLYVASYIFLFISTGLSLIEPAIYSDMFGNAIKIKSFDYLKHACILLLIVHFLQASFSTIKEIIMSCAEAKTSCHVRIKLFQSILYQDISFFDENQTGQLMSRITHDTDSISNSLPGYVETFTTNFINFFGVLPIMLYYSWQLTLTAFIMFPITTLLTKFYGLYIEKLSEKKNDSNAKSNETVQEVLAAIRTVRSFANERREHEKYCGRIEDWYKISMKSVIASAVFGYVWSMIWNIEDVMVYLYGGYLTLNKKLNAEHFLAYVFYEWRLHSALNSFSQIFSNLMQTIGSSRKVVYLLNRAPTMDLLSGVNKSEISGEIVFDGVEFSYPTRKDVDVLKGLQLKIEPGKTTALVGPSGNGKTTIISLIEQYYEPKSGRISLDGHNIREFEHEYYHTKIALVAQEPTLFSGTIRENILYGIDDGSEEQMIEAAEMANVHEFVSKLKKGYDTKCGEKGVKMSGGQKQRIAIARALIRDPKILILDEATSALDAESESLVQEALNRCAKNRTVIVIAHRLSTVKKADRIAVIENGLVSEIGNHEELMKNVDGMYYKLVSKQLEPKIKEEEKKKFDDVF